MHCTFAYFLVCVTRVVCCWLLFSLGCFRAARATCVWMCMTLTFDSFPPLPLHYEHHGHGMQLVTLNLFFFFFLILSLGLVSCMPNLWCFDDSVDLFSVLAIPPCLCGSWFWWMDFVFTADVFLSQSSGNQAWEAIVILTDENAWFHSSFLPPLYLHCSVQVH